MSHRRGFCCRNSREPSYKQNRLNRVWMPRCPDRGVSMRLAEHCTERARATTSHKPKRHLNQSTLPILRRLPRVPCVHHPLAACDILRIALPSEFWSSNCKSPAMVRRYGTRLAVDHGEQRSRPVLGLPRQSCPTVCCFVTGLWSAGARTILGSRCSISQLALVDYASLQRNAGVDCFPQLRRNRGAETSGLPQAI
jgi:hypothetical protein